MKKFLTTDGKRTPEKDSFLVLAMSTSMQWSRTVLALLIDGNVNNISVKLVRNRVTGLCKMFKVLLLFFVCLFLFVFFCLFVCFFFYF